MFSRMTCAMLAIALLSLTACDSNKPAKTDTEPHATGSAKDTEAKAGDEAADETAKADEEKADAPESQPGDTETPEGILGVGKTPEDIKPGESNVYGANFTIIEEPITLASALEKAKSGEGPYKVEATIDKVCQKKGCWFTLKGADVELPIRVKMKDYKFFVPKNAMNMPAVLEGTFKQVTIPQDVAQHYADDEAEATGKPAKKVEGPQDWWEFTAIAIQITHKSS